MSGIHRFLTRRDKHDHHHHHHRYSQRNEKALGILAQPQFRGFCAAELPFEKDEEKKVKLLQRRVSQAGIIGFDDAHLLYALRSPNTQGDVDKALELLLLIEDSIACVVRPVRPTTELQGAVNRDNVTCFLDALLFAMFACQDGFEAMLYKSFNDQQRQKLVVTMRLWINMVRAGALVTTDITKHLQDAIAACGWAGAAQLQQQDTSEAFIFITQTMELPLLTLKMDVFHPGKEDVNDDHKFVHERLLDIPIPPETGDGKPVTLEDCLEAYFNNQVEVKRLLDRRMTLNSTRSFDSTSKGATSHIETIEVASSGGTSPVRSSTPRLEEVTLSSVRGFTDSPTSLMGSTRTNSLIRERFVPESESRPARDRQRSLSLSLSSPRGRRGTLRKEVMLPAWQFFSLIPWYTDNIPSDDAEVAAHFQSQRPMIGMCLKRYGVSPKGHPVRRDTYVDIPTEIGLPHFIQDDDLDERGRLFGEFKLSLQAFVCHQGTSVDSGHYIAIVRRPVAAAAAGIGHDDAENSTDPSRNWLRFDDLAPERVTVVDVEKALREESPYLLFWQILPIDDDTAEAVPLDKPPSYTSSDGQDRDAAAAHLSHPLSWSAHEHQTDRIDHAPPARASLDIPTRDGHPPRSIAPMTRRPNSGVLDLTDTAYHGGTSSSLSGAGSPPLVTPADDEGNRLSFSWSRRGSRAAKSASTSRAPSQGGEGRISATFARLTGRLSRDKIVTDSSSSETEDDIVFIKEVVEAARHDRQARAQAQQGHAANNGIDSREPFARFRSKDPEKGKVMAKDKDKSAREKNGRRLERECAMM